MKTTNIVAALFIALIVASCGTDYRMVTTLDRDGNAIREVYAKGDYTLTAEYRVANRWVFILSGLILITAIVSVALLSMGKITAEIN